MQIEHIFKYFQGNGLNLDKQTGHRLLSKTANLIDKLYKAINKAGKEVASLADSLYHYELQHRIGEYGWSIDVLMKED